MDFSHEAYPDYRLAPIRFPFLVCAIAWRIDRDRPVARMAGWQSGHAAACKAVDAGSIPTPASINSISYKKIE